MEITLEQAYQVACQKLGELVVEAQFLRSSLAKAEAERDEAGRRVVELLAEGEVTK